MKNAPPSPIAEIPLWFDENAFLDCQVSGFFLNIKLVNFLYFLWKKWVNQNGNVWVFTQRKKKFFLREVVYKSLNKNGTILSIEANALLNYKIS